MKFGVREICDVVLRAKSAMKIGNKIFYKNEPVLYFDTLKTSALENATSTVYAQGGKGNSRLIAWEGEKTITFTMEDALISPMGLSVLTGVGLVKAEEKSIIVHKTEITNKVKKNTYSSGSGQNTYFQITLKEKPYKYPSKLKNDNEDFIYVMLLDNNGNVISEPYIASEQGSLNNKVINVYKIDNQQSDNNTRENDLSKFYDGCQVLVDYYTEVTEKAYQVNITPEDFSGNFYLEASTLFRASNGIDMPAEFIIPNCKIQSNFTFTMASSGDPTTFNFVIDAFPDQTRWNKDKKVFAAIQVIEQNEITSKLERLGTPHNYQDEESMEPFFTYNKTQAFYLNDEPEEIINMIFTSVDEDGNIYEQKGYRKNYSFSIKTGIYNASFLNEDPDEGYTISGLIPYKENQIINIVGFMDEKETNEKQGIYLLSDIAFENRQVLYYKSINNNSVVKYNPAQDEEYIEEWDVDQIKYIRICFYNTKIKDMAVLVSEDLVSSEEESNNNLQSLSSSPSLNLQSDNNEEESISSEEEVSNLTDEDLDISDIISLLEEE